MTCSQRLSRKVNAILNRDEQLQGFHMTPTEAIIREQLAELEAIEKKLASMKRALHIALGDVRPSPKVVEWESDGKKRKIRMGKS